MKSAPLLLAVLAMSNPAAAIVAERGTARAVTAVPQLLSASGLRPLETPRRHRPDQVPLPQMPAPEGGARPEPAWATTPGLPPLPLSPSPSTTFSALGDNGSTIPPDTQGAVSATQLVVGANSQVKVQTRAGSDEATYSLSSFFGSLAGGAGVFDPVIQYDPYGSRFIFAAGDDANVASSGFLIAVSQSNSVGGSYWVWRIDPDSSGTYWVDRPQLGFNKDWIVVQINLFKVSDGSFGHSMVFVLPKTAAYAGANISYSYFNLDPTWGGGQVPAQTLDSSASTVYLVQRWNGSSGGVGYLRLFSITGAVGSEAFNSIGYATTTSIWAGSAPNSVDFAPQAGSSHRVDSGDDRMQSVLYRGGAVWAAHTIYLPASSPTRSAVQWWKLSTTGSILQRGRIDDPTGALFAAYPSIAVNKDESVLVGYSTFSASQYASAAYAYRTASDPAGTMQAGVTFKQGQASYYKTFSGTANRWGDYSATVVDPANDTDFWTIQEYAAAPSGGTDRWGLWWARVGSGGPPISACTADGATLCLFSGRFKVQADYRSYDGSGGAANAVSLTSDSGYFWFFSQSNVELVAKIVSFCNGSSGNYGIYASGLTDVDVTFKVTDTKDGTYREYHNALGHGFCTVSDGPFTCP